MLKKKKGPLLRNFTLNQKKGPLLSDFTLKKGPLLRNFTLNLKKRSTFVGFHAKKRSTFEKFYAKPKKRSTFVGFHAEKRFTFVGFHAKKVQFFQIVRVELCLLIHIPDLDQFKGGQCPPCPPYKKKTYYFHLHRNSKKWTFYSVKILKYESFLSALRRNS